jgi:hypothetical protein
VAEPMLTVGLTSAQTAALSSMPLTCSTAPPLQVYPACTPTLTTPMITVTATDGSTTIGYPNTQTLFDSGTPYMILVPPTGVILPTTTLNNETYISANEDVVITFSSGQQLSFSPTPSGVDQAMVNPGGIGNNIVGIDFFQTHDFYIDFTASTEGWK